MTIRTTGQGSETRLKIIADVKKKKFQTIPPQFHHNSALLMAGVARCGQILLRMDGGLVENPVVTPGGPLK